MPGAGRGGPPLGPGPGSLGRAAPRRTRLEEQQQPRRRAGRRACLFVLDGEEGWSTPYFFSSTLSFPVSFCLSCPLRVHSPRVRAPPRGVPVVLGACVEKAPRLGGRGRGVGGMLADVGLSRRAERHSAQRHRGRTLRHCWSLIWCLCQQAIV